MTILPRPRPPLSPSWRRIALYSAIGPLLLALAALWLGSEYERSEHIRIETRQFSTHRRDVEKLYSLMQDAETGQRGYLITGDPDFLAPYQRARANLADRLRRVALPVPAAGENAARLRMLKALIDAKFAEMQTVIDIRDRNGLPRAAAYLAEGRGKRMTDGIRAIVAEIVADESRALDTRVAVRNHRTRIVQEIIWAAICVIGLLSCIFGFILGRQQRRANQAAYERQDAAGRQRAIFDSATDAIILINPSGSIETINPAAERMFGYRADDLLRRDISTLVDIAPGDGAFLDRLGLHGGQLRKPTLIDLTGRNSEGAPVPIDIVLGVMPLPDGIHIVAAARDASERKELERLKDEFISTVSHELRTPLTSVLGSLSLLRGGAAGTLPDPAQRLAEIAENNCQRLIRLINDILDIDQIRSGRMTFHYELIDLREISSRALTAMQALADRKWIKIQARLPEEAMIVCADTERLVQVATNLLSNAIQYSPDHSTITLKLSEDEGRYIVQIIDQGPGIDPKFARHIFDRFAQGARPDKQIVSGSGLGLAISSEIIRNHGGDMWFEDAHGGGACFSFSVPPHSVASSIAADGLRRILICEDDTDAGATIQSILAANGFESDLVTTVREAAAIGRSQAYGLILLDLTLADSDGMDVIRALGGEDGAGGPPVIVISGAASSVMERASRSENIFEWIQKPFDPPRLIGAVTRILDRPRRHSATILHIDDDSDVQELFAAAIGDTVRIITANSLAAASRILAKGRIDLVVLDLGLPDGSGASLLPRLVDAQGMRLPIIIYSAQEVDAAIGAEAAAVLVKSRRSIPDLVLAVQAVLDGKIRRAA